jgi:hypothetical protein
MPEQLIEHNQDLKRLRYEGYDVAVQHAHLLVRDVPYVNKNRETKRGILVSTLNLAGDKTKTPDTHVAMFAGEHPCDKDGNELAKIRHASERKELGPGLFVDHSFSSKPSGGYPDYYEKMTAYIAIIASPAEAINGKMTAKTFPVIPTAPEESVFQYLDTCSSRAGINAINHKLALDRIAIVGLGGTGAYVLDMVAKTPVKEIHLFDRDELLSHNAFRSPGAASLEELRAKQKKVAYYHEKYSKMHRGIIPHEYHIDETTVDQLQGMGVVFVCMDDGPAKKLIVEKLEAYGVPFIDLGMGIGETDGCLGGILRVTTSTSARRDHLQKYISFAAPDENNVYAQNIQIAELNALNATLAVIRWKKLCGFYLEIEAEHHMTYTINGNMLLSDER